MARNFNEIDQFYQIADSAALTLTPPYAIGIWARRTENVGNAFQYIISNRPFNVANSFNLYTGEAAAGGDANLVISVWRDGGSGARLDNPVNAIVDGDWHLVLFRQEIVASRLYVLPRQTLAINLPNFEVTSNNAKIIDGLDWNIARRQDQNADRYYGGDLWEPFFVNADLSDADVAALTRGYRLPELGLTGQLRIDLDSAVVVDLDGGNAVIEGGGPLPQVPGPFEYTIGTSITTGDLTLSTGGTVHQGQGQTDGISTTDGGARLVIRVSIETPGTSTTTADGTVAGIVQGSGITTGESTTVGTPRIIVRAIATTTGTSATTADGTVGGIVAGAGTSAGTSATQATPHLVVRSQSQTAGSSTTVADGQVLRLVQGQGQSAGISSTSAAPSLRIISDGQSDGTSTTTGQPSVAGVVFGTGTSQGSSSTIGLGGSTRAGDGTSPGTSTTTGDGSISGAQQGSGASQGLSETSGIARLIIRALAQTDGISTDIGTGDTAGVVTATGETLGNSTTSGVGAIQAQGLALSEGTSATSGDLSQAAQVVQGQGITAGTSTTEAIQDASGTIGSGRVIVRAVVSTDGTSTTAAAGFIQGNTVGTISYPTFEVVPGRSFSIQKAA